MDDSKQCTATASAPASAAACGHETVGQNHTVRPRQRLDQRGIPRGRRIPQRQKKGAATGQQEGQMPGGRAKSASPA
jgi:hypothetical protein